MMWVNCIVGVLRAHPPLPLPISPQIHPHGCPSTRTAPALDELGAMTCWGGLMSQNAGLPGQGTYRQVEVGEDHVCALTDVNELECFANPLNSSSTALTNAPAGTFRKISVGKNVSLWDLELTAALTVGVHGMILRFGPTFQSPLERWRLDRVPTVPSIIRPTLLLGNRPYGVASGASSRSSSAYTDISLYDRAACGVLSDGTLDCWGMIPMSLGIHQQKATS